MHATIIIKNKKEAMTLKKKGSQETLKEGRRRNTESKI